MFSLLPSQSLQKEHDSFKKKLRKNEEANAEKMKELEKKIEELNKMERERKQEWLQALEEENEKVVEGE